jgi:hypothetical protein
MSHHIDSAAAREDGRLDLCDLYVATSSPWQAAAERGLAWPATRSSATVSGWELSCRR